MKISLFFILIYCSLCLAVFLFQRKLEYIPTGTLLEPQQYGFNEAQSQIFKSYDGLKLTYWYAGNKNNEADIILYFHGNAGNLGCRADKLKYIKRNSSFSLAALSYRGYAASEGSPSERAFQLDAEMFLRKILAKGYKLENIILYGESLGSAMAIKLASKYKVKAVFLEAPFWSASEVAKQTYWFLPVELLMIDKYESYKYLAKLSVPIYMIHGTKDSVTPIEHSRRIYATLPENLLKTKKEIIGADHLEFELDYLNNELRNFINEVNINN